LFFRKKRLCRSGSGTRTARWVPEIRLWPVSALRCTACTSSKWLWRSLCPEVCRQALNYFIQFTSFFFCLSFCGNSQQFGTFSFFAVSRACDTQGNLQYWLASQNIYLRHILSFLPNSIEQFAFETKNTFVIVCALLFYLFFFFLFFLQRVDDDGSRVRGELHLLLVGDPGKISIIRVFLSLKEKLIVTQYELF
jgi:hypothetical protein